MLDFLMLSGTVLGAFVAAVIIILLTFGRGKTFNEKLKSIFFLNERHGLARQGLLWLAILAPVALGFSLGLWSWWGRGVSLNSEGFKTFVDISVVPLAIMALALPIAGLVSRFHSTKQSARQIQVVSEKNNLDAYYSHRKEMMAYFDSMKSVVYLGVVKFKYPIHPVLHKRFFEGDPTKGTPDIIVDSFDSVERKIISAATRLTEVFTVTDREVALNSYLQACTDLIVVSTWLGIKKIYIGLRNKGVFVKYDNFSRAGSNRIDGAATIGCTTAEVLAAIRFCKGYYDNLCDFAGFRRMDIGKYDLVFSGGQKLIDFNPVIESLHNNELAIAVSRGKAVFEINHSEVRMKSQ
ncbi:hypothetical protein PS689_00427 [Pseudomonas fluorescens]|nr:hypothetical protein PS689_00427 [Pseudomonas fluorescens]